MTKPVPVRLAGELHTGAAHVDVRSPMSDDLVAQVPLCGPEEVDLACRAAQEALRRGGFVQWERAEVLERAARLLDERTEAFAAVLSDEAGKPIRDARKEVARCVETLTLSAVEARRLGGEVLPAAASRSGVDRLMFTLSVPIGVVAAITPFNYPLNLVAHKIAPAVAAGCPVVLKPAPQAPLSGIALVELLVEAGLPADWISVVTDSRQEAGSALVTHAIPALISFTGSSAVGWSIAAAAPRKKVALELGSTAPLIVEPDAGLAAVAAKAAGAAFGYAGQSCISLQRLLVHRDVYAPLRDLIAKEADQLTCGAPRAESTDVGPLIEPRHTERARQWIEEAVAGGAGLLAGGSLEGPILAPTVLDAPDEHARVWRKEVFAPVVSLRPYDEFDQALASANDTDLAIHAGVWTNDLSKAMRATRCLDFAGVVVNDVPTSRLDLQPYGGVRDAGNTREGPRYAVGEMVQPRCVSLPV